PWDVPGGWRLGQPAPTTFAVIVAGRPVRLAVTGRVDDAGVRVDDGEEVRVSARWSGPDLAVTAGGVTVRWVWGRAGDDLWVGRDGSAWRVSVDRRAIEATVGAGRGGPVTSPMPGTVLAVHVAVGDVVRAGQPLVVVEAMKMEHAVTAPVDGTVSELSVKEGQTVALDETLAVIEAQTEEATDA
ncbi:MAG: acetyl-CoA carboxylase biotin carboxyl carrier protein subunit, partial [Actinomycetes bacterium]